MYATRTKKLIGIRIRASGNPQKKTPTRNSKRSGAWDKSQDFRKMIIKKAVHTNGFFYICIEFNQDFLVPFSTRWVSPLLIVSYTTGVAMNSDE